MKSFRIYLLIWFGQFISMFGTTMTGFALGVWFLEQNSSVSSYSTILATVLTPSILLTPIIGVFIDRVHRKRLILIGHLGAGVCSLIIFTLFITDSFNFTIIAIIIAVSSTFNALVAPSLLAATSTLVKKEDLAKTSGLDGLGRALCTIAAAPTAVLLLSLIDLTGILVIDIISFSIAVISILFVSIPHLDETLEKLSPKKFLNELMLGPRYIKEHTNLIYLLIFFSLFCFFIGVGNAIFPPYVLSIGNRQDLAMVLSAGGIGTLIGGVTLMAWGGPQKKIKGVILFAACYGTVLLLAIPQPTIIIITCAIFIASFMHILSWGCNQVIWQKKVELSKQGRVFTFAITACTISIPIGAKVAGWAVDNLFTPSLLPSGFLKNSIIADIIGVGANRGIALMFVISAFAVILLSALAFRSKKIWNIEAELADKH